MKESNALNASQCLLKSHLSCLASYIHFVKNGNVTMKNYLNESLLSLLCFIIDDQGSFEKGFDVNCQKFTSLHMLCDTDCGLVCTHAIEIGRVHENKQVCWKCA